MRECGSESVEKSTVSARREDPLPDDDLTHDAVVSGSFPTSASGIEKVTREARVEIGDRGCVTEATTGIPLCPLHCPGIRDGMQRSCAWAVEVEATQPIVKE